MADTVTDADIIEALGDTVKVAKQLGITKQQVSHWKLRGISWQYRSQIADLARKKRLTVPMDFLKVQRKSNRAVDRCRVSVD